jgi:hypothetical protein
LAGIDHHNAPSIARCPQRGSHARRSAADNRDVERHIRKPRHNSLLGAVSRVIRVRSSIVFTLIRRPIGWHSR